jgi:hypothetical protein
MFVVGSAVPEASWTGETPAKPFEVTPRAPHEEGDENGNPRTGPNCIDSFVSYISVRLASTLDNEWKT